MLDPQGRQLVVFKGCLPNARRCHRRAGPSRSTTHPCSGYPRTALAVVLDSWHGAHALHVIGRTQFRTLVGLVVATCRGTQCARAPRGGSVACKKIHRRSECGSDRMNEQRVVGCGCAFRDPVGRGGGPRASWPQHLSCIAPRGGCSSRRGPTSRLLLEGKFPRRQRPSAAVTTVSGPGTPRPLVQRSGLRALYPLPPFMRLRISASERSTDGLRRLEAECLDAKRKVERTMFDCAPPPSPCG